MLRSRSARRTFVEEGVLRWGRPALGVRLGMHGLHGASVRDRQQLHSALGHPASTGPHDFGLLCILSGRRAWTAGELEDASPDST